MKFIFSFFSFFAPLSDETDVQFIASETFCFIPEDLRSSPWGMAPLRLPHSSQPCKHRGSRDCKAGRVLGSQPPQQSRQAWFRGGETKGGWNSQFVNLMDPLRLLAAIGVEKDGEGSGKKKKKKTVLSFLILLSLGQRGLGTTGAEQRVNADVSVLRRRVPLAEWTKNFWLFNPNLSQKVIRPMTAGPKPTASPWVTISTDYANKTQDFFEAEACFCSRHPQAIPENHIWCFPSVVPLAFLCISDEIWSH